MLASTVLTTAITFAVLVLVFGILNRNAEEPARWADDAEQTIELRHGRFIRQVLPWAFGVAPVVGLAIIAGLAWDEGSRGAAVGALVVAALFVLISWILFREAGQRVLVDPSELRLSVRDGDERGLRWDEVREVRFSTFWNALVLVGDDGRKVRVSMFLRGFDLFAELVRERIDRRRWTGAFDKLERIRKGFRR